MSEPTWTPSPAYERMMKRAEAEQDATIDAQATEIAALRGALEREKRSEWREGLVAVIDHEGNYLGCMGTMTWAVLARKEAQG